MKILTDEPLHQAQFEDRCISLSQGIVPVISKNQILCHLKTFDQISEIFPSLDQDYKQKIKQKYGL